MRWSSRQSTPCWPCSPSRWACGWGAAVALEVAGVHLLPDSSGFWETAGLLARGSPLPAENVYQQTAGLLWPLAALRWLGAPYLVARLATALAGALLVPVVVRVTGLVFERRVVAVGAGLLVEGGRRLAAVGVDRVFSHHRLQVEMGQEPLSFRQALAAEQDRLEASAPCDEDGAAVQRYSYFSRGLYDEQLERWLDQVGEQRVLVLETSLLQREPGRAMEQVADHLGISGDFTFRRRHRNVAVDDRELDPRLRTELTARYRPSMERLRDLVGVDRSCGVSP